MPVGKLSRASYDHWHCSEASCSGRFGRCCKQLQHDSALATGVQLLRRAPYSLTPAERCTAALAVRTSRRKRPRLLRECALEPTAGGAAPADTQHTQSVRLAPNGSRCSGRQVLIGVVAGLDRSSFWSGDRSWQPVVTSGPYVPPQHCAHWPHHEAEQIITERGRPAALARVASVPNSCHRASHTSARFMPADRPRTEQP